MKKLLRIACLAAALALPGVAYADDPPAWQYGYCYTSCGDTIWTDYGTCCNAEFQCSDGYPGQGWTFDWRGDTYTCFIR